MMNGELLTILLVEDNRVRATLAVTLDTVTQTW